MPIDYKKEGRIAIITINRPEQRNALDAEARQQLVETMINFRDDPELWIGIITGAGDRAFCAGAQMGGGGAAPGRGVSLDELFLVYNLGDKIMKPLIAAINGYALGGGLEIALGCDIRIAAENARLGVPEVTFGMSGAGGPQRLVRCLPRAIASWMILSGQQIDAQEAYRVGLVNKVVPLDKLMPAAMEMAETICLAAPLATRIGKEVIIRGAELTLDQALQIQRDIASRYPAPEDRAEGGKAFAEKRKPVWKGR